MTYLNELLARSVVDDRVRDLHRPRPARRPLRLASVTAPIAQRRSLLARPQAVASR